MTEDDGELAEVLKDPDEYTCFGPCCWGAGVGDKIKAIIAAAWDDGFNTAMNGYAENPWRKA
jgi:hypothetical protein